MCPFCIATAAMVAASASGTGGLAALVTSKLLKRSDPKNSPQTINPKEVAHVHDDNGSQAF